MAFLFGQTVTLHSRTLVVDAAGKPIPDAYGNDVYTETDTDVTGVPVWPRNASEKVQGEDTLITGLWAVLPSSVNVFAVDEVTVYGQRYKVDGEPGNFTLSPLTGFNLGHQVALTRVS